MVVTVYCVGRRFCLISTLVQSYLEVRYFIFGENALSNTKRVAVSGLCEWTLMTCFIFEMDCNHSDCMFRYKNICCYC